MTRDARQAGFTLLELLVGLAVLSFILAGLSQSVRYGLRAGGSQARQSEGSSDLDAVDRALRRLIEQADPGTARTKASLQGTAALMAFTSELPDAAAAGHHADFALGVDDARRLVLHWSIHRHVQRLGPPPEAHEIELVRGIAGLEIAYWRGGWQAAWSDTSLPALVRLRIRFPPGDPRHWPDIIVAPRQDKDGGVKEGGANAVR